MSVNCAIYLRISQDPNADGLAVDRQRGDCQRIARERGWTVVEEYSDTVSASKRTAVRPAYDRMFDAFKAGTLDALVVWDLDRLTRQPRQLEDWIDLAETRALLIVTANGEADLTTDGGILYARIKADFAAAEIARKGARQRAKNLQNAAAGKPVPGRRRYGYESDNITPREPEAQNVRDLYAAIIAGESIRSRGALLGKRTGWVRDVILNKSYAGWVKHKGEYSPGTITPLVSLAQWEAANAVLADPTRRTSPGSAVRHVLSGIAECGVCGAPLHYMRAYMCSASTSHVNILSKLLEPAVSEEVFFWAMEDVSELSDGSELGELVRQATELERQRAAAQELYVLPGADKRAVTRTLARLGSELEAVTQRIDAERASESLSGILAAVRGTWWERREVREYTEREEAALEAWPEYWAGLGLERQRSVVRSLFRVVVNKGREPERVVITRR